MWLIHIPLDHFIIKKSPPPISKLLCIYIQYVGHRAGALLQK